MLVTAPFFANQALGLRVIRTLVDTEPNIIAIKDDVIGEFARKMALASTTGGRSSPAVRSRTIFDCTVWLRRLHVDLPALHAGGRRTRTGADRGRSLSFGAARLIRIYDHPWMEFADTLGGGFDAMFHGRKRCSASPAAGGEHRTPA